MNTSIDLTNTNNYARASLTRLLTRNTLLLIPLALTCFGLSPIAHAADGDLGKGNTSEGANALQSLTTGIHNTALGGLALFSDTAGSYNTAIGSQALKNNKANNNTADGFQALLKNTTGGDNTATGWRALFNNTTGDANTANGLQALNSNTIGTGNTAVGIYALVRNTTGSENTAHGLQALASNTTGSFNTAVGEDALFNNSGNNNIAVGFQAGQIHNLGDNNIYIGNEGSEESNAIRIGQQGTQMVTLIAGISGTAVTGAAVVVNGFGQLGVAPSSARFKDEIKAMGTASEAILTLKPVTFHYKKEIDPKAIPQFGLVAEEVEKVNPDLVTRDAKGEAYTVRYEAVNAMLLNEFLKQHKRVQQQAGKIEEQDRKLEKQEATIAQLKKGMEVLTASMKEQGAQIRKVSDQLELSKPAPQIVDN